MVIFLYNLEFFVWLQQRCLANTVFTLGPINHVIESCDTHIQSNHNN